MSNGSFNTLDVKRVCETKLEINFRDGKEYNGWYSLDGRKAVRITVPKGRKDIPPKTYSSMANQLLLTEEEFKSLLECPLSHEAYVEILRKQVEPQEPPTPPSKVDQVNEAIKTGRRLKCDMIDGRTLAGFCLAKPLQESADSFELMNDQTWVGEAVYFANVSIIEILA
jgi:hypothetical protein